MLPDDSRDGLLFTAWSRITKWIRNGVILKNEGLRVYRRGDFVLTEMWDAPQPEYDITIYKAWARLECGAYSVYNKCRNYKPSGEYIRMERGDEDVFWNDSEFLRLPDLVNDL